jgi:tetratricopeptide (TPR) repeat protein
LYPLYAQGFGTGAAPAAVPQPEQAAQTSQLAMTTGFYGYIKGIDLEAGVIIVEGNPMEQVSIGQSFDVVLGQEVWARIKVFYIEEDTFEATVIEGNAVELDAVLNGRSETINSGMRSFRILDPDGPQKIACKMKDQSVRHFTTLGQNKDGFVIRDKESGNVEVLPFGSIDLVVYSTEPLYSRMKEAAAADDPRLPGFVKKQKERREAEQREQRYKLLLLQADRYQRAGRYGEAGKLAAQAAVIFPDRYKSYYYSGEAAFGRKNYRYAAAYYNESLKRQSKPPELGRIQLNLAHSYYHMDHLPGAEYYLKRAIKNGESGYAPNFLMARISYRLGKFNNALDYAEAGSKSKNLSSQENAEVEYFISNLYYKNQGDTEEAWKHIQKAKKLDDRSPKIAALHKELMLSRMKEANNQVQFSRLGGTWKSTDNRLYLHFFEEAAFVLFKKEEPGGGAKIIMFGGDMEMEDDGLVTVSEVKQQRLQLKNNINIRKAQILALNSNMSDSDEFTESDDIVFKVKKFDYKNFEMVLDGKIWKLTPMQ